MGGGLVCWVLPVGLWENLWFGVVVSEWVVHVIVVGFPPIVAFCEIFVVIAGYIHSLEWGPNIIESEEGVGSLKLGFRPMSRFVEFVL